MSDREASTPPNDEEVEKPRGFEQACLASLAGLGGEFAKVNEHIAGLYQAVYQTYQLVAQQNQQLADGSRAVQEELKKFQTGGPQRAMAGVFHKLFRDLVAHGAQLDEMVGQLEPVAAKHEHLAAWLDALRLVRDRFEKTLHDWGCAPVAVNVGADEFDPEVHEAVPARDGEVAPGAAANVIVKVRRRGWKMHDTVLQYPQVVVSG